MKKTLRVLHVDDSELDLALLTRHLNKAGYNLHSLRVVSGEEMKRALYGREWDLILCDYSLPNFNALSALAILRELNLDVPFIIISGTIGDDLAVEAMKAGANDYLMKDNLACLVPTIERQMREAKNRRARREAEVQVRLHATALEAAANAIVITDNEGKVNWVNPAFTELTGYGLEEVLGKSLRFLKSGKHDTQFYKELWDTVLSGRVWHGELINRRKDGSLYFEEQTITPVKNGAGEITNFIAIKQDVTKHKRSDQERARLTAELESERQRLNDIISNVPGIVWETWVEPDPASHRTNFITNYVETMLGYSAEDWLSKPSGWLSVIHPDDRERAEKKAEADWEAGRDGIDEFRFIAKDGRIVWVEARYAIVRDEEGRPIGRRGVTLDITERKQAEERLRESEDRNRDLIEHSHDLICTHDLTGRILSVNQMAVKVLGYDQETLLTKNIRDILFSGFRDQFDNYIKELKEKGVATGVMSVQTRSGERRVWEYTNTLRTEGVAKPVVRGVAHDITEQMRAERALRKSESELRTLFAAMTDVILELNSEGRYLKVAPTNPSLLYKPTEELLGKRIDEVFPKEQADFFVSRDRAVLESGKLLDIPEEPIRTRHKGTR
nr:PAS domain S-box protein [Acidobacteriota bacterium]